MTELTDEAVKALLAHYDLPTDCDCDGDDCVKCSHYPTFQERASKQLKDAAPDLARALLDARAERDSIGTMYATVAEENKALEAERDRLRADAQAAVALSLEQAAKIATRHWEGEPEDTLAMEAEIRALAPADGLAEVQALRAAPVQTMQMGWVCPRYGTVHSPHTPSCFGCVPVCSTIVSAP